MQEPSDHVVKVVDSLLYQGNRSSGSDPSKQNSCSASSVSSMEDDFSTLPVTPTLVSKRKKKRSTSKRLSDSITGSALLDNRDQAASFSPIGGGDESSTATGGAAGEEWESSDTVVAKLRRELTHAKMDLEVEKSSKKKREKTLVRLAKELNKRIASETSKDKQIEELEETIEDLTARLKAKTDLVLKEIPHLRAELAQKTRQLQELTSRNISQLSLGPSTESAASATPSTSSSSLLSLRNLFMVSVCGAAVAMRLTTTSPFLTMRHFVCAAAPPGMVMDTNGELHVFRPPFWVPGAQYKKSMHSLLCSHAPYTALRVGQSKLVFINEDSKKQTQYKAPRGIQVGLDTIVLLLGNKKERTIPAPWTVE